jgi:hypothetical protein
VLRRILLLLGETPSSISARKYGLKMARIAKAEISGFSGIDLTYVESAMPGRVGAGGRVRGSARGEPEEAGRDAGHMTAVLEGQVGGGRRVAATDLQQSGFTEADKRQLRHRLNERISPLRRRSSDPHRAGPIRRSVAKWLPHPLTGPCLFDILQSGWQGTECNSIN